MTLGVVDFVPGCGVSGGLSGESAPCFPQSVFHSLEPLCVSFLSLASVSLLPVPSGSPLRTTTTPILLTAVSREHTVGAQQTARMCTLASSSRGRWAQLLAGLAGPSSAGEILPWGGEESVGRGCSLGRQYLVAKVTSTRHGDVAMEMNHLGREGSSEGEAVGGVGDGRGPSVLLVQQEPWCGCNDP